VISNSHCQCRDGGNPELWHYRLVGFRDWLMSELFPWRCTVETLHFLDKVI
jgi:hypothetical protein